MGGVVGIEEDIEISSVWSGNGEISVWGRSIRSASRSRGVWDFRPVIGIGGDVLSERRIGVNSEETVVLEVISGDNNVIESSVQPQEVRKVWSIRGVRVVESHEVGAWGGWDESSVVDLELSSIERGVFNEGSDVPERSSGSIDGELLISSGGGSWSASSSGEGRNEVSGW